MKTAHFYLIEKLPNSITQDWFSDVVKCMEDYAVEYRREKNEVNAFSPQGLREFLGKEFADAPEDFVLSIPMWRIYNGMADNSWRKIVKTQAQKVGRGYSARSINDCIEITLKF